MRKQTVTTTAATSANTMESQIPVSCQISGMIKTNATWNTSVRKNEISADVSPSFSAVKKEEPKIGIPQSRNENE